MKREMIQHLRGNDFNPTLKLYLCKGRHLPAIFLLVASIFSASLYGQAKNPGALASSYLSGAQQALQLGNPQVALVQLNRGLEIDPQNSDLYTLRSQLFWQFKQDANSALADSLSAIKFKNWRIYSKEASYINLAQALAFMHRWKELVQEIDRGFNTIELRKIPQLLSLKCQAYFEAGNNGQAETELAAALQAHPDNAWLMAVAIRYRAIPNSVAFLWFKRFESKDAPYLSALFWYLHQLPPSEERLSRCRQYLSAGGTDPWVYADALQSAQTLPDYTPSIESYWLQGFLGQNRPLDLDVAQAIFASLRDKTNQEKLSAVLAADSLEAIRDFDHDGWPQEQISFKSGRISQWHWNHDQTGVFDLDIRFKDGYPAYALQKTPTGSIRLDYGNYPEVISAWVLNPDSCRELIMPHRLEEIRLVDIPDGGYRDPLSTLPFLRLSQASPVLDPVKLTGAAWLINEYQSSGSHRVIRQIRQTNGLIVSERIDSNAKGQFDRYYWYENGQKQIGFRDIQENGEFSIVEFFNQGKPSQYSFVSYKDGTAFSLGDTGKKAWDLNRDNRLDRRELLAGNAWLYQEFSPQNDNNFDAVQLQKRYAQAWGNF